MELPFWKRLQGNEPARLAWACIVCGLVGAVLGFVYLLLAWWQCDALTAIDALRGDRLLMPHNPRHADPMILFVLVSGIAGWYAPRLAESVLRASGPVLLVPTVAFASVAAGSGWVYTHLLTTLPAAMIREVFILEVIFFMAMAGGRIGVAWWTER